VKIKLTLISHTVQDVVAKFSAGIGCYFKGNIAMPDNDKLIVGSQ
jgi:hypothetical protein